MQSGEVATTNNMESTMPNKRCWSKIQKQALNVILNHKTGLGYTQDLNTTIMITKLNHKHQSAVGSQLFMNYNQEEYNSNKSK